MKNELKVGIVVGISLFLLGFLIITIGDVKIGQRGYTFFIRFNYISGLSEGAKVMVSGMDAGVVKELFLKNNKVYVKIWVRREIKIPIDSIITISSLGLLGEKYVDITLGKEEKLVEKNTTLVGIDPVNVSEILTRSEIVVYKMERAVTILEKLMGEKEMLEAFESSIKNLAKITKDSSDIFSAHKDELIKIIERMSLVSQYLSDISKENKEGIKEAISNFKKASLSINELAKSIDKETLSSSIGQFNKAIAGFKKITEEVKPEEIEKIILSFNEAVNNLNNAIKKNEKQLSDGVVSFNKAMDELNKAVVIFNSLMKEVGTQSLSEAAKSLSKTAKNLEELSSDLKKNPWRLFKK